MSISLTSPTIINALLREIRHNPLLLVLAVPSHATESVADKTGNSVGGLLNSTLGNLTESVSAFFALKADNSCW